MTWTLGHTRPTATGSYRQRAKKKSEHTGVYQRKFLRNSQTSVYYRSVFIAFVIASVGFASGCIRNHYQFGLGDRVPRNTSNQPNPISSGGEHPRLDRIEKVVQYPVKALKKIFQSSKKPVDDPVVLREQTLEIARQYLVKNELQDVYIDVRRYDPKAQWERTKANPRISPVWKYTGGVLHVATYTIFPGRVFHSDFYNPFSDTLSINSSRPSSSLYQASLAKDYRSNRWLGTYAMLQIAPIFPIAHHTKATSDVLTYARVHDLWELEKQLYGTGYANIGASAVSDAFGFVPQSAGLPFFTAPIAFMAAGAVGKVTGSIVAKQQEPVVLMARERNRSTGVSQLFR